MIYQFKGRCLFWLAGLICLFSIVLTPVGLIFIYMAMTAYIKIENDMFVYKMLTTKRIYFRGIRKMYLSRPVEARYKVGYAFVNFATVIPLTIEYQEKGGVDSGSVLKKVKLSLNYFEKAEEIAEIFEQKTRLKIGEPE